MTATLDGPAPAPAAPVVPGTSLPTTSLPTSSQVEVEGPEVRRSTATLRVSDLYAVVGALAASVSLTALVFNRLLPLSGGLGFVLVAYVVFIGVYVLLVSMDESGPAVRDRVAAVVVQSLAVVVLLALLFIVGFTLYRGRTALPHLNLVTQDLQSAGPLDPLTVGGIKHGIVGTLEQIGLALLFTVPLGITCAVFLNEVAGRFSRFVRTVVEAMTALPSIVAGLFVFAALILALGVPKSGFAASVAISVEMLPIVIRASDVVLRLVPSNLKEASLALGAGDWRTVRYVVLPTARSGLTTAVILGTARGIGETAPVLLTAGFTAAVNYNPFDGPQVSLPLLAFQLIKSPQPTQIARGFAAGAVLLILILILFAVARIIGGRGPGQLTRRQERGRTRRSARDLARYEADAAASELAPAGLVDTGHHVVTLPAPPPRLASTNSPEATLHRVPRPGQSSLGDHGNQHRA